MSDAAERRLAFRHSARHVEAVLAAVTEQVDGGERQYLKARDLDADACNEVVGSVLALVADQPDAIETVYGLNVEVAVERYASQPKGLVWEVRRS